MADRVLLESEKRVLVALVRHPRLSDRQLASELGMQMTTVTAIRRRLCRRSLFRSIQVPSFEKIGFEMLAITFGSLSCAPLVEDKIRHIRDIVSRPEFVYALIESTQDLFIQISRNYTDAMANVQALEERYREKGYLGRGLETAIFPFDLSDVHNYFDFSPLLSRTFWPEKTQVEGRPAFGKRLLVHLRAKEREILRGLVQTPDLSDIKLARQLGISRMTVGRGRKRFEDEELLMFRRIPSLRSLGMELLVLTHGSFHSGLTEGLKYYVPKLMEIAGTMFLSAINKNESIGISAFSSYHEFKMCANRFAQAYREQEIFSSPPTRALFSLTGARTAKDHEYGPLLVRAF